MLKSRAELPLERDASRRFLPGVITVMVYLAALALAGVLALDRAMARWDLGLRGTLTLQIPAADGADTAGRTEAALAVLRETQGVARARALSDAEVAALLEPWLGPGNLSPELPVPKLVDVRLAPDAEVDLEALRLRLEAAAPGARLDDHKVWLKDLLRLIRSLQGIAAAAVLLIVAAAIAIVVFTTRAGLAAHHEIIKVLHLIGARDSYIARQYQNHALVLGLRGGVFGLALAALTLLVLSRAGGTLAVPVLPGLALEVGDWIALAALPVVAALIATLTARATVMRALGRMP